MFSEQSLDRFFAGIRLVQRSRRFDRQRRRVRQFVLEADPSPGVQFLQVQHRDELQQVWLLFRRVDCFGAKPLLKAIGAMSEAIVGFHASARIIACPLRQFVAANLIRRGQKGADVVDEALVIDHLLPFTGITQATAPFLNVM